MSVEGQRGQRSEVKSQRLSCRKVNILDNMLGMRVTGQRSGVRGQRSVVRGQRSEVSG